MIVYHYSNKTGEFLGATEAQADPMGDGYLIPADAVTVEPGAPGSNQAAVWDGQAWQLVDDWRGWSGYDAEGNEQKIVKLAEKPDPTWTTEKPVLPEPVPTVVSMRQARLALHGAGLLDDVTAALEALAEPDKTQAAIEWEYASRVERGGQITQMLAGQMGLTAAALDDLFVTAAGL